MLREDSPVNLTRSQVRDLLQKIHEIYGGKCIGSFAKLTQNGLWLKTSQGFSQVSLGGTSEEFCETWPKRGIVCSGFAFQLQRLERGTGERGSGLLQTNLLPTPTTSEAPNLGSNKKNGPKSLVQAAIENWTPPVKRKQLFATPTCMQRGPRSYEKIKERKRLGKPVDLQDQIYLIEMNRSFPTPTATDYKRNGSPSEYNRSSLTLGAIASQTSSISGKLNPQWVEWLMGFPVGWTELKG